ncbi:MAG: arylsulfatase [Puniceicoccaceae bacterium]
MRKTIITSLFVLLSLSAFAARPNVVLVITDDQGYGDIAAHGNPIINTPAMDALHAESVRLTNYHVSPTCAPTRGALLSGHYTNRAGPWHTIMGRSFLRPESTTMGTVFGKNGYKTGMFGKWHLGDNYPYRPQDRGFQEVVNHNGGGVGQTPDYWNNSYFDDTYFHNGVPTKYKGYCTDVFFQEAKRFIGESIEANKPFFAYICTNAPHGPFHVEDRYWKPYVNKVNNEREAIFYGMIENIDDNVADLREFLDKKGVADDTIFIFTTDNGTASGEKIFNDDMRGKKGSQYEGGHRVPFFLHWPKAGLKKPRDIDRLTAHIDILPTLIELCGLKAPLDYSFDGRSLVPLLFRNKVTWPDRTIITDSQRVKDPIKWKSSATMTNRWRLINGEELYDIIKDPSQTKDVASQYPEVVKRLRRNYDAWWESVSVLFDKETRIIVGNKNGNPAELTAHDWITEKAPPWHQSSIRKAQQGSGFWALNVEKPGKYRIALRRWPQSVNAAIAADVAPGEPVPGLEAYRETPGQGIPATSAILKMGKIDLKKPVTKGAEEVVFNVNLPKGDIDMYCFFEKADGSLIGSYYAVVEKL